MLELTLTTGTELKIGDDIRIVFRGDTTSGRLKVAVEAPREKRIERVKALEDSQKKEAWSAGAHSGTAKEGRVAIVRNQGGTSKRRQGRSGWEVL